ncbi:MAG: hypothetical protein KDJ97_21180, partial [Anaerolineae bacterium]|nr:hypothetical protein [Anaerolineae bacterium]
TYLGFHEYDWPTMDRLHRIGLEGPSEPQNRVPLVGVGRGNDGMWRCLRYRRVMYEGIRQKFGDKHTVIITECGMTQGVWGGSARDIGPWAKQLTVPHNIPGGVVNTPIHPEDYWQTLLWYNGELMKDDFVMGACLFVTGAAGLPEWETFEHLGAITDRICAFQKLYDFDDLPGVIMPEMTAIRPIEPEVDELHSEETATLQEESQKLLEEDLIETDAGTSSAESAREWRYTFETGQGLGLLVGDIGIPGERIAITRPDGQHLNVTSGSKGEHGAGGFETYAQKPGRYQIEFLDQKFNLTLSGQFTRVNFYKVDKDDAVASTPEPEEIIEETPPIEGILPEPPVNPTPPEIEAPLAPQPVPVPTPPQSIQTEWTYTFETGQGLGLLVGDIGIPGERISIIKPDGRWVQVTSGSKGEHGIGGFEMYAQQPGRYQIEFMEQRFTLTLTGQFTRVNFRRIASGPSAAASALAAPVQTPPPATDSAPPAAAPPPDFKDESIKTTVPATQANQPSLAPAPPTTTVSTSSPSTRPPTPPADSAPPVAAPPPDFKDEPSQTPAPAAPASQPSLAPAPASTASASPPPSGPSTPPADPTPAKWRYRMESGRGMSLLVGDIGVKGERITITRPDGRREQLTSGSKAEYGIGGFELYAQQPGVYRVEFLDQTFELQLTGQFTKVIFEYSTQPAQPEFTAAAIPAAVSPPPEPVFEPKKPDRFGLLKVALGFIISLFKRK